MLLFMFFVSLLASVVGAICGIGGGVIIKPVLDAMNVAGVAEVSFLSGCTVLCMSLYSVSKAIIAKESLVKFDTGTPLAIGAAIGGVLGKSLFSMLQNLSAQPERVGGYQAICLAVVTVFTLVYTLNKSRIKTMRLRHPVACAAVGLALGVSSSFLGIGGGPINLVVLYFFFSMETKEAAQNSLYTIVISQTTSLLTTVLSGSVPDFRLSQLILMVCGGILGGMLGRKFNKKLSGPQVDRLFGGLLLVIVAICCYNSVRFLK